MCEQTLGDILQEAINRRRAELSRRIRVRMPDAQPFRSQASVDFAARAVGKFYADDHLSDQELEAALAEITAAYNALELLGERHAVARESLMRDRLRLEDWARSRNYRA